MTSLPTAYTPLESLLLFQALRSEGLSNTTAISFNRISEQLQSVPLVRNDPTYDGGRLSPDALRELYLWLLKEEVKRDLEVKDNHESNGDISSGPRKRKAASPVLPTVSEAAQHSRLIPQLITRLYTRYRENAVRQIRDCERRYAALTSDVNDIQAGTWDERLQKQYATTAVQSPKPSTSAHTQPMLHRAEHVQPSHSNTASSVPPHHVPDAPVQVPAKRYSQATIDAVINHGPESQSNATTHRRTSSNTALPPLSEMAPQSPHFGIPRHIPGSVASMPPHMQHAAGPGYSQSPPNAHQSPYASHHAHPIPSPQMQQNSMGRPSSSPRLLPPPPGMNLPTPTAGQHSGASALRGLPLQAQPHYPPQHRSSIGPSPTSQTPQHGYTSQVPPQGGYYTPPPPPYQNRRPSYPQPGVPQQYANQSPHMTGHSMQPYYMPMEQAKPAPKQRLSQQQVPRPQQMPTPVQRAPQYAHYPGALATGPRPHVQSDPRLQGIVAALATPPRPLRKPLWKSGRRPAPVSVPDELPQPDVEPLSPVQRRARPAERRASVVQKDPVGPPNEMSSAGANATTSTRQGRKRRERSQSAKIVASSTTEDLEAPKGRSRRSVGVIRPSPTPDSEERPQSKSEIKSEPLASGKPPEEHDASVESVVTPASGPMTRKRRGTMQSQPQPASKRKRQESPSATAADDTEDDVDLPRPRPTTIIATRNLAKMAATIMNDITSHKHASYFATPVRDKDANGYSEIIKQPQNLKSIRSALTAGSRAVAAAASALDSPSATPATVSASKASESSTTVELERTKDLTPPKAIVNGAQLEREIYKMLCNAVMFNPGEDGLVADTREMFEDVEAKIREWRGAERDAGTADEEDDGKAKRRKL